MYLSCLWGLPLIAGLIVWALPSSRAAKTATCVFAVALFAYSLYLIFPYVNQTGLLRLEEMQPAGAFGIRYRLGVDGISLSLCWLTTFLIVLALIASWKQELPPAYWAAFLGLESALLGVFVAQNLFYFYVFWDLALIPMFFIIGLWGSEGRRHAAIKFVLYTFLGSLALLVGIIALSTMHRAATGIWTWDIPELYKTPVTGAAARWIFGAMALGFAVKIPLFPFHNWLPEAHTEAPAAGSVLLAGAMLKMGVYGFLRILMPVFPELSAHALPVFGAIGAINILYGALCAMAQTDLKKLVAYTSISHLGYCMVGLFSRTPEGIAGGSLQMINHGLSTGGLFLLVGMMYRRTHRRGLEDYGNLAQLTPWFTFFFALVLLSSIGIPGLNGFVGEAMSLIGMAKASRCLAVLGAIGAVFAASYGLPTFQKVFWAPAGPKSVSFMMTDMDASEQTLLWVLAGLIVALGIYPGPLLRLMQPAVMHLAGGTP